MADVRAPIVSVRCYPVESIPQRTQSGYYHADVFSDLVRRFSDVASMINELNPTITIDWARQPEFIAETGITFIRFNKDGTFERGARHQPGRDSNGEDLAGFMLKNRDGFLDWKIGSTTLNTSYFDQTFTSLKGTWKTRLSRADVPSRTRIVNVGNDEIASAQSSVAVVANRSFRFDVRFLALLGYTSQPASRIEWGGGTCALWMPHSENFQYLRKVNNEWHNIFTLPIKVDCARGEYLIRIEQIADRTCITINNRGFSVIETNLTAAAGTESQATASSWPSGIVYVATRNCRASFGGAWIKWADAADAAYESTVTRSVRRGTYLADGTELGAYYSGWAKRGSEVEITPSLDGNNTEYEIRMKASPAGLSSPLVNKVFVGSDPIWSAPDEEYLEIRSAINGTITINKAIPDIAPMATAEIPVDRTLLPDGWETFIGNDHIIEVWIKQTYENDDEDDELCLFYGYMYPTSKSTEGFKDEKMTLTCFDPLWRLKDLNAVILPTRYPPLDFLLLSSAFGLQNANGVEIFGSDAVSMILSLALGTTEASALNGNGDGQRFFSAGHPPLLSTANDTFGYIQLESLFGQPPTNNGFFWPPPWFKDAISWIGDIAKQDQAVFWYTQLEGNLTARPVPVYGRIVNLMQYAVSYEIPDRAYVSGDANKVLKFAEVQVRPDRIFNEVFVYSEWGAAGLEGLLPGLRMAMAQVPSTDDNAPARSWPKTYVIHNDILAYPGAAEAVAYYTINEIAGRAIISPQIRFRGLPQLQTLDKITVKADSPSSDLTLGLDGVECRVERIVHKIAVSADAVEYFLTDVNMRPTTASGF